MTKMYEQVGTSTTDNTYKEFRAFKVDQSSVMAILLKLPVKWDSMGHSTPGAPQLSITSRLTP